jgi:hypothetical protein
VLRAVKPHAAHEFTVVTMAEPKMNRGGGAVLIPRGTTWKSRGKAGGCLGSETDKGFIKLLDQGIQQRVNTSCVCPAILDA